MSFIKRSRSYTAELWKVLYLSFATFLVATYSVLASSNALANSAAPAELEKCSITVSADETNYSFIKNSADEVRLKSILKAKGYEASSISDDSTNFILQIKNDRQSSWDRFSVSTKVSIRRRDAGQIYVDRASRNYNCQSRKPFASNYRGFLDSPVGVIVVGTVVSLSEIATMCPGDNSPFQASVNTLDSLVSNVIYKLPSCPTALSLRHGL